MVANSVVGEGIFMVVLVACKNEEDLSKHEAIEWLQHFSHYKSMGIFSDSQRQLTPQPEV